MPRVLVLTLVLSITLIIGLAAVNGQVLALAVPLVIFLAGSFFWRPEDLDLEVERVLALDRASPHEEVSLTLTLKDASGALEEILVLMPMPEGLTLSQGSRVFLAPFESGPQLDVPLAVQGPRGYYVLPPLELESQDPFGLIRQRTRRHAPVRLFVLPSGVTTTPLDIRVRRTRVYPGLIPARKGGAGVEFYGLREYQYGDDWRWLNHRVNARQESDLFVNEFELERAIDSGLLLDVRTSTNLLGKDQSLLEYSIQATATLAEALLSYGNRVGLYIFGGPINWTFPGSGKKQYEKILRALASASVEESQLFRRLDHLPVRLFPSRCLLIMISPLSPEDLTSLLALRAKGYQLIVIIPDPISFEMRALGEHPDLELARRLATLERRHLLNRLARGGVQICEWDVDQPLPEVIQRAFGRPTRGRALAMQRA